jgi:hypothetical protein
MNTQHITSYILSENPMKTLSIQKMCILTVSILFIIALASSALAQTCTDSDGDGFNREGGACGTVDCDDNDPRVYPGAPEICDGKDSNCDGWKPATDKNSDGDSFPQCAGDCNDNNATVYPGAPEICDGLDNNCDYVVPLVERDLDGDGFRTCSAVNPDCNDNDPLTYPGGQEFCSDGKDNDCDGFIDENGNPDPQNSCICPDIDGDGFLASFCGGQDCNDTQATVFPGAPEDCTDGLDNDCDGLFDIQDPDAINCPASCRDNDGDSYYVDTVGGFNCGIFDCDDNDARVHPGAAEVCDGKDTNCDGFRAPTDVDNDNDGVAVCAGDCNDNNPNISPLVLERHFGQPICSDGIDNDCDSLTDSRDSGCIQPTCKTKSSPKQGPHFTLLLNPDNTVHPDNAALQCGKCHSSNFADPIRQACQRCHADPSDPSDPLNGTLKALYPMNAPYGFGSAPNVRIHSSTVVGTQYGNWTMGQKKCTVCHNPHAQEQNNAFKTGYGMYVKEYVCYDNNATGTRVEEFVEFTAPSGAGSFADGPPHNENICEMCHTQTNHHQRDGSAPGGQSHLDGQQCTFCHIHEDGFLPTNSEATSPHNTDFFNTNCQLCHVETGGSIDFSAKIPDALCQQCHGERTSHTSDITKNPLSTGKYTYSIMCVDCHNPMLPVEGNRKLLRPFIQFTRADGTQVNISTIVNTTRRGGGSLSDGAAFNENICDACHSQTSHNRYDGTGGGVHQNGIDYTGQYCMICHDHNKSFMDTGKTCAEENEPGIVCSP